MAAVVVSAFLLGMAGVAGATSSEPLTIRIVNTIGPAGFHGRAILTGAVNASCQDGPAVVTPSGGGFHVEDTLVCQRGTLFLAADGTGSFELDPVACIARVPQGGTFQITGGTGEFAGATGGGTWTGQGLQILARSSQGCALDQPPRVVVRTLTLTGTLST